MSKKSKIFKNLENLKNFISRDKKALAARTLVLLIIGMLILFVLLYLVFMSKERSLGLIGQFRELLF